MPEGPQRAGRSESVRAAIRGWAVAVGLAAAAQAARIPIEAASMPFITYVPFIALSAAFGGLGPGLLTTGLCTLESIYFALEPVGSFRVRDPQQWYGVTALLISGAVISVVSEHLRRAERIASRAHLELATIQAHAPVTLLVLDEKLRVQTRVRAVDERGPGDILGCVNALDDPRGCGFGPDCGQCRVRQSLLNTVRTGTRFDGLEAWVQQPGTADRRCYRLSATPMQMDDGPRVLVCAQDVTERNVVERQLQQLAALIDLSHDAIVQTDANGVIRAWNKGAEETYGWKAEEVTGRMIHTVLGTKGPIPATEISGILIREGRWDGELQHTDRSGETLTMECRQVLVKDEMGRAAGILKIGRNITVRKRYQRELVHAHRRTSGILESISDGFTAIDKDWRYTYVNSAGAKILHSTPEQLLGRSLWEVWPDAPRSPFGTAFRRAVAENVAVPVEAYYPEPLNAWLEVRCYPSSEGLSLFFTDTTERKRTEEALRQSEVSERMRAVELEEALLEKTVLLKEVHHRVKNNLTMISSVLGMQAEATESGAVKLALEESQQRVQSIALIHEHLYGNARLDRIHFADYTRELVDELQAAFGEQPERVAISMNADAIDLEVNLAIPCGLILNELISNALKYAFPDGRRGRIEVLFGEPVAGTVQLVVQDDGAGLPESFDWRRTESLGLRIVQILARQIRATIETPPQERGTRFELAFAREIERARGAAVRHI